MGHFKFETELVRQLAGIEKKRYVQQIRIVKTLYINGSQTSSRLCKRLKMSVPNMMGVLNEMIDKKIIQKKGQGNSKGGRKPDLYGLVDKSFYVVAVDMSIYKVRISIFDAGNNAVCAREEYQLKLDNQPDTLDYIINLINDYIFRSGIDKEKLLAVGISMPGLVDSVNGVNYTHLYFGDTPISEIMEKKIGRPVFIENDAKAMALAEFRLGCAQNKKDILVLFLDWGIGLGMILNGKLYRGMSGFAGEFSHISIVDNGVLCSCGKLGCLQTVASGIKILEMVEQGVKERKTTIQLNGDSSQFKYRELEKIIDAALKGDQYAIRILGETGKNLGKGIATLMQLFNPELIVLCGILSRAGELITTPIKQSVNAYVFKQIREGINMKITGFGDKIGMYGALAVIMENVFEEYITSY